MSRATRALINLAACRHNLQIARQAAPASRCMAIIKANGYGHGMVQIARALKTADAFGVATVDEAIQLREAGIPNEIVLLEGFSSAEELNLVRGYRLQSVLHDESQLGLLEQNSGTPIVSWIKLDTGMHRLGFNAQQLVTLWPRITQCASIVQPVRMMSHLANADDRNDSKTTQQLQLFHNTLQQLNITNLEQSIANSAGILGWSATHHDWVRPGIMLYGVTPFNQGVGTEQQLQPVMTLTSKLITVKQLKKGDAVGYSGTYVCPEDMPVGVVAIGYGDGYPRHAKAGTPVLVNGQRVPVIGRVSMDMLCVDLRQQPTAKVDDPVVLWGEDLPVEEIAECAGTIAYELLCSVSKRVQFVYQD